MLKKKLQNKIFKHFMITWQGEKKTFENFVQSGKNMTLKKNVHEKKSEKKFEYKKIQNCVQIQETFIPVQ